MVVCATSMIYSSGKSQILMLKLYQSFLERKHSNSRNGIHDDGYIRYRSINNFLGYGCRIQTFTYIIRDFRHLGLMASSTQEWRVWSTALPVEFPRVTAKFLVVDHTSDQKIWLSVIKKSPDNPKTWCGCQTDNHKFSCLSHYIVYLAPSTDYQ